MTVVVLVTHEGLGEALLAVAGTILGHAPDVRLVAVSPDEDPAATRRRLSDVFRDLSPAEPPLVLTDLPGATPHNLVVQVADEESPAAPILTGVNLPMLLRVLNHVRRPVDELAELALEGGRNGLFAGARRGT